MLLGSATEIEQWAQTSEQGKERVAEEGGGWVARWMDGWMQVIIATVKLYVNIYCVILHK